MLLKEIFEIISVMNKSEKSFFNRYCKLYSNNLNNRNYLFIYDEIHKQVKKNLFDEAKCMKLIDKKMTLKHFNNAKQYLHQQLMNSLLSYHKNSDADLKISNRIQSSIVLKKKGLYVISMRILDKAKKEALGKENIPQLMSILSIYSNMINLNEKSFHKALRSESKMAIQQYDELNRAALLYNKCTVLFISEFSLHPKDPRIPNLYEDEILSPNWEFITNKAKIHTLSARVLLATMTGNLKEIIRCEKEIISICRKKGLMEDFLLKSHRNIINTAIQLKDEATYLEYKERFLKLDLSKVAWYGTFLNEVEIFYCRVFDKKEQGLQLVEQLKDHFFERSPQEIDPGEALFIIHIICFLCQIAAYQIALDWILFWYDTSYTNFYSRRRLVVKVMELIIHTELENHRLIHSLNNALKRDMQKQFTPEIFEKLLLSFFYKQDGSLINLEQKQAFYTATYQNFLAIDLSQHQHFWFQLFDFKRYFHRKSTASH